MSAPAVSVAAHFAKRPPEVRALYGRVLLGWLENSWDMSG